MGSVYEEISRLETAKSDIEAAIENCGVNVPNTALLDTYSTYIRQIPAAVFSGLNANVTGGTDQFIQSIKQTNGLIETTVGGLVSASASGLAPKIGTEAAATIATQADEWVLTSTKGALPTWRKLPSNAFSNSNTVPAAHCTTAAGTAAKTATYTYYTATANRYVYVTFRYANSKAGAITLNINSTGAKPIYINGSASSASNYTLPAGAYLAYYDGSNYHIRTDGVLPGEIQKSSSSTKVANDLVVKIKTGSTEGTDLYTFNGSSSKTLDIKQGTGIGLTTAAGAVTISNSGVRSVTTGDNNGTIKVNTNGTSANVAVKGLGSAAYTASTDYAVRKTLTNENLNDVITPGFYNSGGGNTVTNKPDGVEHFGLEVIHGASGSYYVQILFEESYSNVVWRRHCQNGTWSSWTKDVYTDTHYTTHLYVGAKSSSNNNASNATTTNGNTYLKLFDNSTLRHQYLIKGTGNTSVTSDASGNITINSPTTLAWGNVTGKPTTFTPSVHNHDDLYYRKANVYTKTETNTELSKKLDKITYEFNKELALGGDGKVCIGKFPMYDSNITVDISSTTSTTYHGTLVIATQNINTTGGGSYTATVYGDASNTLTGNIKIKYVSGSNLFEVYINLPGWSKNSIHVKCVALAGAPTNIVEKVSSIPSNATIVPVNALTTTFVSKTNENNHNHATNAITALTGYTIATSAAALATSDSLNTALGKLEYKANLGKTAYDWYKSVTGTDNDAIINKWEEIVGFIDSVKETETDILDTFVTRKTAQVITGKKNFNTNTNASPLVISRTGGTTEAVSIGVNDSQAIFEYVNDEKSNAFVFKLINSDTESSDGSGANTNTVTFTGSSSGSTVAATTFQGRLAYTYLTGSGTTRDQAIVSSGTANGWTLKTLGSNAFNSTAYLPLSGGQMNTGAYISWNSGAEGNDLANWSITDNGLRIISSTATTSKAPTQYATGLHVKGRYGFQIASQGGNTANAFFIKNVHNTTWNTLVHSNNYTSYTPILNSATTHATNSSVIYAPTTAGTLGHILTSNGSGAPIWTNPANIAIGTASNGVFYIAGTGSTAGKWLGSHSGITSYYTGLTIAYKIPVKGADTTTININNLGAKTIKRNDSNLTTHVPVNSVILLVYDGTYFRWSDYDANSYAYVRQYLTNSNNTEYPLLFRYDTEAPSSTYVTKYTRYDSAITVNPSTNTITATTFKGTATNASKLNGQSASYYATADSLSNYVHKTVGGIQSILGGLVIGASSDDSQAVGRIMLTGNSNPLIGIRATGGTAFYFQSTGDIMYLGPTSSKALSFVGSTGAAAFPSTVTSSGFIKSGSSASYVLLGDGGHKAISDFLLKTALPAEELKSNVTTITKKLTVTQDWMDVGIAGTNLPANGTYIVQVSVVGNDSTGNMWSCLWSGVMSWHKDGTNDSDSDEILLHRSGHAYGNTLYLRTVMRSSSTLKLQIAANTNIGKAYTYTFKFKQIL